VTSGRPTAPIAIDDDTAAIRDDYVPTPVSPRKTSQRKSFFVDIEPITDKAYSDSLPRPPPAVNTCSFCMNYDSNSIHAEPIKNRTAGEIKRAYALIIKPLKSRGLHPKLKVLDIEASKLLVHNIDCQPPHVRASALNVRLAPTRARCCWTLPFSNSALAL
jgi:hypothetical protein